MNQYPNKQEKTKVHVNKTLREIKAHGTKKLPLEVYEDDCRVFGAIYTHWHKECEMIYIEKGKGKLIVDNKKYDLKPNMIVLIGEEQLHYVESDEKDILTFKSIVYDQSIVFDKKEKYILHINSHVIDENQVYFEELKQQLLKIVDLYNNNTKFYELLLKSHMFQLVYCLLQGNHIHAIVKLDKSSDIVLSNVIEYIHQNYMHELKSEQLAEMAGYSKFHFTKIFKEYTGKTVVDYIHQLRMNKSLELLKTDISISALALEVGYENISYFIKRFKLMTGKSPIQYRKDVLNSK